MEAVSKKLSLCYLLAVPVAVTALAFIIGHISYKLYVPFWLINGCLMVIALRTLQGGVPTAYDKSIWYLVFPWALIAIFGGMGPPPETPTAWAALATEQRYRYIILIISGTSVAIGYFRLHKFLSNSAGARYSLISTILIIIASPLFIANMIYWGFFLTDVFIKYSQPIHPIKPDWLKTMSNVFTIIRMIEVALIYLSTAAMAFALSKSKLLSKTGANFYIAFSVLGALFNFFPQNLTGPLAIAAYLSIIPAFTLLMPYFTGVNLAYKQSVSLPS